jgi:hypothetical protein
MHGGMGAGYRSPDFPILWSVQRRTCVDTKVVKELSHQFDNGLKLFTPS